MSKLEEFKKYVKKYPKLISYVKEGKMTWQDFYELYDIYGENDEVWSKYISESMINDSSMNTSNTNNNINSNNTDTNKSINTDSVSSDDSNKESKSITSVGDVVKMIKNMDVNKVQDGISSLQKAVDLFSTIFIKDGSKTGGSTYTPRPIYRRFDD